MSDVRLIDAEALKKKIYDEFEAFEELTFTDFIRLLNDTPTFYEEAENDAERLYADMSEKEESVNILTEHLNHWERLVRDNICDKEEGKKTIIALKLAIEALKKEAENDGFRRSD